jgi:hypothetical protein
VELEGDYRYTRMYRGTEASATCLEVIK